MNSTTTTKPETLESIIKEISKYRHWKLTSNYAGYFVSVDGKSMFECFSIESALSTLQRALKERKVGTFETQPLTINVKLSESVCREIDKLSTVHA